MKPTISPATIAAFLAERYARVEDLTPLAEGEESQAFAALADRRPIVVRTNADRAGFDKDRLAASLWPSVRAPAVMAIEPLADAWVCVSERVTGNTLQSLGRDAEAYGREVAVIMDEVARSDVSYVIGYGPFDSEGRGAFASWQDFVAALEGPPDLVTLVREHRYGEPRALVHGDFGSNNVLVTNGRVTGVIDWSEAMVGDPLYDVANLFFWRPWLDCMEVQCRYFELHAPERLANPDRLARYQLRIGLQVLAEATRDGDATLEGWAIARCRTIASGLR